MATDSNCGCDCGKSGKDCAQEQAGQVEKVVRGSAGWVTVFGILEVIAGLGAITYPLLFGEALASVIGFILIFAGVAQFFGLIRAGSGRIGVRFFISLFYLLAGIILVANPLSAMEFLTLILGVFFIFEGTGRLLAAYELECHKGLMLFNGLVTLVLGMMIVSGWPGRSDWMLGLLIGINLIISGMAAIAIAASLRKNSQA